MEKNGRIRVELTPEQQQQVKDASGQDVAAIEFTPEELEQRIAPSISLPYTEISHTYTQQG